MNSQFLSNIQIERFMWARPMPLTVMIGAFVAVVALTLYIYRRPSGLPTWLRISLAVLRFVILAVIVAVLFEPTAVFEETRTVKRRLPVLIDVSRSMSLKDQRKHPSEVVEAAQALGIVKSSDITDVNSASMKLDSKQRRTIAASSRLDLAKSLLSTSAKSMFDSIGEDIDVSYYAFGKRLEMISDGQNGTMDSIAELKAVEPGTSIAESLEAVANTNRARPLSGIVLLTDGIDTSSRQADDAIYDLGTDGIAVYPVPIGIANPDDISIRNIVMQEVAFSGDTVPVRVQIRSRGYENRMTDVTVLLNGRGVARRSVTLKGGLQFEDIFFNVDVHEKGVAQVELIIEPFADEATAENNRIERSVRVVNEKINVLCMEGSPRWEYRYLRAMLKRDPRINATFIATRANPEMARNSSEYIASFPESRQEAFKYDLVILGDVDSSFFTAEAFLRLEELVADRGGSLLMLCGSRHAPTSYAGTPVENMLPVRFDSEAEWEEVDESVYPVLTPEGKSSLIMTLETESEKNDRVWTRVAPMDRIPPLIEAKPGATILAELSDSRGRVDRYPLVSWQRYGTGKCMAMGTDRLWLLRFKTGDKYHWRLWSQCIQFLTLSRLMGEHKRIRLETDRSTYPIGEQALLYANVLDDEFEPITQSGFDVTVSMLGDSPGEPRRVTLRPDMANPGLYEGYFSPQRPGRYRMEANSADRELSNTTEFQVADIKPEMENTDLQIEGLKRIAELSGGKCLGISEFKELSSLIDRQPHTTTVQVERPLWDNWLVISLLAVLMGTEWILRRRYDLP